MTLLQSLQDLFSERDLQTCRAERTLYPPLSDLISWHLLGALPAHDPDCLPAPAWLLAHLRFATSPLWANQRKEMRTVENDLGGLGCKWGLKDLALCLGLLVVVGGKRRQLSQTSSVMALDTEAARIWEVSQLQPNSSSCPNPTTFSFTVQVIITLSIHGTTHDHEHLNHFPENYSSKGKNSSLMNWSNNPFNSILK